MFDMISYLLTIFDFVTWLRFDFGTVTEEFCISREKMYEDRTIHS